MTLIAGPLDDAVTQIKDDSIKEMLKLAIRNVARLKRIVDALLDFSQLQVGRLQGRFKPFRLSSFTSDLAGLFRATIERSRIEVRLRSCASVVIKSLIFPASAAARAQRQSDIHGPIPKTISIA